MGNNLTTKVCVMRHFLALLLCVPLMVSAETKENPLADIAPYFEQGRINTLLDYVSNPQNEAQIYTMLGRSDKVYEFLTKYTEKSHCKLDSSAKKVPATPLVKKHVADHQVVMVNENHFNVASRALVAKWLPWFKEQGFTHVGFEAFGPGEKAATEFYFQEPIMSNLIQKAEVLGFKVFGYEAEKSTPDDMDFAEGFAFRDKQQAENIIEQITQADDNARFLIFAGWAHIAEAPLKYPGGKYRTMSDFLKNDHGINPLTIDTTACPYSGDENNPLASYAYMQDGDIINVGSVQNVDIQIRVPKAPPTTIGYFRKALGDAYIPNEADWPENTPVILQAYNTDKGYVADRIQSDAGEQLPLYLPSGNYRVTLHSLDGELIWEDRVELN
ncbi:hypothetical protein DEU30_11077 [Idiomarina sp. 017G]|nr:hypothetical protein DEU30_11077 [Idiomarina sp. 017G]